MPDSDRVLIDLPLPPARIEWEPNLAGVPAQLDAGQFAAAWAAGWAMTLEEAVADALSLIAE